MVLKKSKKLSAFVRIYAIFAAVFVLIFAFAFLPLLQIAPRREHEFPKKAQAASGDVILLWDGASIPSGWTCISCSSGQAFFRVFPRGSTSYGAVTGSDTHTHTLSFDQAWDNTFPNNPDAYVKGGTGPSATVDQPHSHTWPNPTVYATDHKPPYKNLKFIRASNPSSLPAGTIGMFAVASTSSLPAGWSYYSEMAGRYLRGANDAATGGTSQHSHNTEAVVSGAASGTYNANNTNPMVQVAEYNHTHSIYASGLSNSDNNPPYINMVFAKLSATSTIPAGLIAMFDATPPAGWETFSTSGSPMIGRLIRGSNSYGATGGSSSHNHGGSVVLEGSGPSNLITDDNTPPVYWTVASVYHRDRVSYWIDTQSSLPTYRDVIFGRRVAVDCGFRIHDGYAVVTIACEPSGILTSPLRIYKGTTIYGIVLVPTTDPNASRVRIYTSSGTKSLRRL